jgi:hypothetical protein
VRLPQVAGLRDKLAVCLSKTQNDDKLIAALRKELVAATGGKAGAGRCVCPTHLGVLLRCKQVHLPRLATAVA